ncbi:MAG TPA: hypothetical protein DCQ04_04750 [Actinobacteria bacterium]|nr:hypothetical protein [Actinomycetota bacterium]
MLIDRGIHVNRRRRLQVPMLVLHSIVGVVITGLVTGLDSVNTLVICVVAVAVAVVAHRGFRAIR